MGYLVNLEARLSNKLLEAALTYAARGWYIFPCVPGGKTPLTPHGFKDACIDSRTIVMWWTKWPNANVAISTGEVSGLDVLDVDRIDAPSFNTYQVETPRGRHYYFQTTGQSSMVGIQPGIDVRAKGGYIIAPPSPGYVAGPDRPLAPWPESLRSTNVIQGQFGPGVEEGGRDNALYRYCCWAVSKGWSTAEVSQHAIAQNETYRPPLPAATVFQKVSQAEKHRTNTLTLRMPTSRPRFAQTIKREEVKWLIDDWVPAGELTYLDGDMETGKSTLAFYWAAAHPGRTLFVSEEEDAASVWKPKADAVNAADRIALESESLKFPKDIRLLEERITEYGFKLIVIDPLMDHIELGRDINTNQHAREVVNSLKNLAHKTGCAFLIIRHWNKKTDQEFIYRAGGSQEQSNVVRCIRAIVADPDDRDIKILFSLKHSIGKRAPIEQAFSLVDKDGAPLVRFSSMPSNWTRDMLEEHIREGRHRNRTGRPRLPDGEGSRMTQWRQWQRNQD